MTKDDVVYLCVWSGDAKRARELVASRYAGTEIREFAHRRLRESGYAERIRLLRGLQGRALVFSFGCLTELKHRQILQSIQLTHRCEETVLCDRDGGWESIRSGGVLRSLPRVLVNILLDVKTLVAWWLYLRLRLVRARPVSSRMSFDGPEIAYLIPSSRDLGSGGGAMSHIRGFLQGLQSAGITCRVFAGTALAQDSFANEIVAAEGGHCFFSGADLLSYNFAFARGVQERLTASVPRYIYQRHLPFSIAGALLSQRLRVPLVLEYNGPEAWIAQHWNRTPFVKWIELCEELSLRCAARISVVSEALKAQLLEKGIAADRIRVNPNGVDLSRFYPGCGRVVGRKLLGAEPDEVLVGFVGSFSLWHGIEILQQAIIRLLSTRPQCRLRFVLIGEGLLHGEMRSALSAYEATGEVIFTGPVARDKVAEYLDAADILVSPHIPMPDGSRFFGSPTKLFEYMAMGKGIVASRLEQLAEVLEHDQTAWLVTPGSVEELAEAILALALDRTKREGLGFAARQAAVKRHSWSQNVAGALAGIPYPAVESRAMSGELHHQAHGSSFPSVLRSLWSRMRSSSRRTACTSLKLPPSPGNAG